MAITKNSGRQTGLWAEVSFTYADLVSATPQQAVDVPPNAVLVGGELVISTAFNSGTSDVIEIGDGGDDDRYTVSDVNVAAAGRTALTITGYRYTVQDTIDIKWTGAGTAPTAGAGTLRLQYLIKDRATETQPS